MRFGPRRKGRPLHAKIGSAFLAVDASLQRGFMHDVEKLRADRIGKADMRNNAVGEERRNAAACPIKKLIGNDEVQRAMFFFKGPTALTDTMRSTPSIFIPKMFARKFNSEGEMRWPRPCRARKTTSRPSNRPKT